MSALPWTYDDGGRHAAGFVGTTGDCVTRAIAIATQRPYRDIYDLINESATRERPREGKQRSRARTGVRRPKLRRIMDDLGWQWTPTMQIGAGCTVHLRRGELPQTQRLVVSVSRHVVAVVDGVCRDTHDPSRGGTRCVYGYWSPRATT